MSRFFQILKFVVPVAFALAFAPSAQAANLCVGSHPLCSGPNNYPATAAGLQQAFSDSNVNATFPGADTVYVGAGTYSISTTLNISLSAPLTVIGEGAGETIIEAGANGVTPVWLFGSGANTLDISAMTIRHEGYNTGYGMVLGSGVAHDIAFSVIATTGSVRGAQISSDGTITASSFSLTGSGASGVYSTGTSSVLNSRFTGTDGLATAIQTSSPQPRTYAGLSISGVRNGITSDNGPINVHDVFANLGTVNNAVAVNSENFNNCGSCALELAAANLTVVGSGSNQAGVSVGGTASDNSPESGVGTVTDSYFDLGGSGAKALRCTQSGTDTSASLDSSYVAAPPSRIVRTGSCGGTDSNQLDTSSLSIAYNLVSAGDYRPVAGSPLIDAGDPSPGFSPGAKDVDGLDRVYDGDGDLTARVDIGAYEYQPDMAPAVTFTATPDPVDPGQNVSFSATAAEPDGGSVAISWDFGDSTSGSGATPTHAYTNSGTYKVTATAIDNEGQAAKATRTVHVNSGPPTKPNVEADLSQAVRNQEITFTASGSTDPDFDPFTYEWTFTGGGTASGASVKRGAVSVGTFTATVRAVDSHGEESPAASVDVTIVNQAPGTATITATPDTAFRGEDISFSADATDPDGDTLGRNWDFGDGSSSGPMNASPVLHSYTTVGEKTVTVAVNDAYGGTNGGTKKVTIVNRDPLLGDLTHSGGSQRGDVHSFGISAADEDGDPVAFRWDFGDGGSATGAAVTHAFAASGTFPVTVTADDGQGSAVVKGVSVTIAPPSVALAKSSKAFKRGRKSFTFPAAAGKPFVTVTASVSLQAKLGLARINAGWRKGRKCSARKPASGTKRCDLVLAGSQTLSLPAGVTRLGFGGGWKSKKLPAGRYRMTATPDGGGSPASVVLTVK